MASFCTVPQAKLYIPNMPVSSGADGLLQLLCDGATQKIQSVCCRDFFLSTYTDLLDGLGTPTLPLRNTPIASVTSVAVGAPWEATRRTLTVNQDYVVSPTAVVSLRGGWWRGIQNVAVTYVAGYSPIPADLVEVCAQLTALAYKRVKRLGDKSISGGGQTVTFDTAALPEEAKLVIDLYSRSYPMPLGQPGVPVGS